MATIEAIVTNDNASDRIVFKSNTVPCSTVSEKQRKREDFLEIIKLKEQLHKFREQYILEIVIPAIFSEPVKYTEIHKFNFEPVVLEIGETVEQNVYYTETLIGKFYFTAYFDVVDYSFEWLITI